jgi:hypothetical protein
MLNNSLLCCATERLFAMKFELGSRNFLWFGALLVASISGCSGYGTESSSQTRQEHVGTGTALGTAVPPPAESQGISLAGAEDFGGRGNFGNIAVHRNFAYLGSFRAQGCPGYGVSVADVSNPFRPRATSTTFAAHPGTAAEDVKVYSMSGRHFSGDVAVVGLQDCSHDPAVEGLRGIELWNVSDPRLPVRLGGFQIGTIAEGGVHELATFTRDGRYYVIVASSFYGVEPIENGGEVVILDVTNPRRPKKISDFSARVDGRFPYGSPLYSSTVPDNCELRSGVTDCRAASSGGYPVALAHSVSVNASTTRAYVSYWDSGMVILDISDLDHPRMIGRGNSGPEEEGDLHSAIEVPYFCGSIALTTDEDFSPWYNTEPSPTDVWGFARIWDISNPRRPIQIGRITSPHSNSDRSDGIYAAHNPVMVQNLAFFSWYTDGVRVYDLSNPRRPQLAGFFDAPRVPDPAPGKITLPAGAIWGIQVRPPYVYASDIHAGLYVLRLSPSILSRIR